MNAYLFKEEKLNRRWFAQIGEFLVERLVLGFLAALIVYSGYRLFLL
jgi:hypothetical protein